jgi:hypothetical protein
LPLWIAGIKHIKEGDVMAVAFGGRLAKIIEPALAESGFSWTGKIFLRSEGNLNGIIAFVRQPMLDSDVTRFAIAWGITLPGVVARYYEAVDPRDLDVGSAATGDALVPPARHYSGSFPQEREIDPIWGINLRSEESVQKCAGAVLKGLNKDILPIILDLLEPGALLEEISSNRDKRRLTYATWWGDDAIYLLVEDGPIAQVRKLLAQDDDQNEEFLEWVENRLEQRERGDRHKGVRSEW